MLFVVLLVPVKVYASEVVFNLSDFGALGDLGYGLVGGAQFDFDGSNYVIGNYDNLTSVEKEELLNQNALQFLFDYAEARKLPVPYSDSGYYSSLIFEKGIRSAFNQYQYDLNTGALAESYQMSLSRQRFSDWSMYQNNWYSRYIESFNSNNDIPSVEVNPDANFIDIINKINDYDGTVDSFFWKDYANETDLGGGYKGEAYTYPFTDYSYCALPLNSTTIGSFYSGNERVVQVIDLSSIEIYGSDNVYSFSITVYPYEYIGKWLWNNQQNNRLFFRYGNDIGEYLFNMGNGTWYNTLSYSYTGTLNECFTQIHNRFRNVSIYVNGEAWAYVGGEAPANPIIPEFPDVINIGSGDPIGMIDLPNSTDYEGYFDLTSLFDALKKAIAGASDSDFTTNGILTGEAVKDTFKDKTGELVGSVALPIASVIDDSFPIEGTLNYPNIVPYAEPIGNAFEGTTILAQLINACQTVLPEPLILVFWGIVFILFIIGLIKILHK